MVGLRKLLSSSVHLVSSTAVKNCVLFFQTQKVKQGLYNTRKWNMQDKSTPVMMKEQQVLDSHEKRVRDIQLKYYMYITIGLPCLALANYVKY